MTSPLEEKDDREFSFSDKEFHLLSKLANELTGIVLEERKKDMVYGRLVRRIRALKLKSFAEYCELVQDDQEGHEIGNLVNAITTNLTRFFREDHHFEHLEKDVLIPMLSSRASSKRLRIWSAGCSSGMEPYSIAMTLKSALKGRNGWDARVLATDIDTNMLGQGREGAYPIEQYENIPTSYRGDVELLEKEERIRMSDDLKAFIAFKQLNLLEGWPMSGLFDAVFCRNVVIYFDKATQAVLFDRIADILKPGGWFYLGHSENLLNFKANERFELRGRTIYQKVH